MDINEAGMIQARRRASWDLGDPSWANAIILAYLNPEADAIALADEKAQDNS